MRGRVKMIDVEDQEKPADHEGDSSRADLRAPVLGSTHSDSRARNEPRQRCLRLGIRFTSFPLPRSSGAYSERC